MLDPKIDSFLKELEGFARENDRMWNIPPETGRFLHMLVRATNAQSALEVGMSNGYSGIWIASALRSTGGHLTTLEADPWKVELATENFAKAGLQDIITIVEGDARENLGSLEGVFDFAFVDATKDQYLTYLKLIEPKMAPNSLIFADNAISHGASMQDYFDHIQSSSGLEGVMVPIGTGVMMALKDA
ncbi:MAG: O-methyltransferase [Armatimonadetes bacterium]|nr:O-methyltransferase [Armatimonadota bacterium]